MSDRFMEDINLCRKRLQERLYCYGAPITLYKLISKAQSVEDPPGTALRPKAIIVCSLP